MGGGPSRRYAPAGAPTDVNNARARDTGIGPRHAVRNPDLFTDNDVRSIAVGRDAQYVRALVDKLVDIDKSRINRSDDLVLRKAVFGLIELLGVLEERIVALEPEETRALWGKALTEELGAATPDQIRLGEVDD